MAKMVHTETFVMPITRMMTVGEIEVTTDPAAKGMHEAAMSQIGSDYQHVHWNEKRRSVFYEYVTNEGTRFGVTLEATAAASTVPESEEY